MTYPYPKWALRRLGIIPVFFLSFFQTISAQNYLSEAKSLGIGGCYTSIFLPGTSCQNPAVLATVDKKHISTAHGRPFIVRELGVSSLNITAPATNGTFNLGIINYGIKGFQNFSSSLSYGLNLHKKLSAGISFHYYNTLSEGEWKYLWNIGIAVGLFFHATDKTKLGIHLANPFTINNYPSYGKHFPSILSLGISHLIYEKTTFYSECSYLSQGYLQYKIGIEYSISTIVLQSGYHSTPNTLSFGIGYNAKRVSLNFAYAWSSLPGAYPAFQITYHPKP